MRIGANIMSYPDGSIDLNYCMAETGLKSEIDLEILLN